MNVTGILTTVNAVEQDNRSEFHLEFHVRDEKLYRAQFTIYQKNEDPEGANRHLGGVYYEDGIISCNLPANEDLSYIFGQVKTYLAKIETYISTDKNQN